MSLFPTVVTVIAWMTCAAISAADTTITRDIEYARVGDVSLKLDLYVPSGAVKSPVIVYVHGGAWRAGSKEDMPLEGLVKQGFAVASVDYRLSTDAKFPAMMHDIKAAIRFVRAKGKDHGLADTSRIAVVGSSAGGHLAALVGVTNGVKELEGTVGTDPKASSDVQAIISIFGGSNLQTILAQSTPGGLIIREPALELLLGGLPDKKPELARLGSPVTHVDASDPPLLLIHGDADPQMPYEQSLELKAAYGKAGLKVQLITIPGGKHGGKEFYDADRTKLMTEFLESSGRK
ncbi:MAG TPA: alpha/beta hydrolase [Candidatus Saccharimonadia bacterium]|nr:alpha/beta hydrolase [Candidatus Saccharimonadia bacterium]